jgi:hypothetical protein
MHLILKILGATILAAAIAQFVLFAVFLDLTMILRPFSDMISYIDDYLHVRQHGDVLGYLWSSHTEHHQPIIRALCRPAIPCCVINVPCNLGAHYTNPLGVRTNNPLERILREMAGSRGREPFLAQR